jgi:hypothetical protein
VGVLGGLLCFLPFCGICSRALLGLGWVGMGWGYDDGTAVTKRRRRAFELNLGGTYIGRFTLLTAYLCMAGFVYTLPIQTKIMELPPPPPPLLPLCCLTNPRI